MDRRFLTVLGVSLVFALVVSAIFYQISARSGSSGEKVEDTDMKDLVVSVKPLSVGTTIKPEDVKVIKVPAAQFPVGGIANVEEVIDRPVVSNILLDEPIHEGAFGHPRKRSRTRADHSGRDAGCIAPRQRSRRCRRVCPAGHESGHPGHRPAQRVVSKRLPRPFCRTSWCCRRAKRWSQRIKPALSAWRQ